MAAPHQVRAHRIHRALGEPLGHGARQHGPRLRDRVDAALVVLRRPERRAVVVVAAPVPLAVPGQLEHAAEAARPRGGSARRARRRPAPSHSGANSARTPCRKKPSQVLSPRPCQPDAVHAVVPVAAADERQPVRARRSGPRRSRAGSARRACRARADTRGWPYASCAPAASGGASRNGTVSSSTAASPVVRDVVRHRDTAARAGRPSSACAGRGRSARATSAGRRLPRTGGRPRAGGARARGRAARARAPSRPAADRGSRRRRPAGSSRRAPRAGSSGPDRAASGSSAGRTSRPACAPGSRRACRSQRSTHGAERACGSGRASRGAATSSRAAPRSRALAEQEHELRASRRARATTETCSAAHGIEPRAEARRRASRAQSAAGSRERAVAAEERRAVAGGRARRLARVRRRRRGPRTPWLYGLRARIAPRRRVELGHDVQVLALARRPERPTRCRRRRSAAAGGASRFVEREQRELHRVVGVDEHVELVARCRARDAREAREPGRVPDDAAAAGVACAAAGPASATRPRPSRRRGRRAPRPVGSPTGSLANGVSRFSRLFSAQVYAAPDAVTIVPKPGLAITFTHGIGVSSSPSRTIDVARGRRRVKPPRPLAERRAPAASTGVAPRARAARAAARARARRLAARGQVRAGRAARAGRRARRAAPPAPRPRAACARPRPCGRARSR